MSFSSLLYITLCHIHTPCTWFRKNTTCQHTNETHGPYTCKWWWRDEEWGGCCFLPSPMQTEPLLPCPSSLVFGFHLWCVLLLLIMTRLIQLGCYPPEWERAAVKLLDSPDGSDQILPHTAAVCQKEVGHRTEARLSFEWLCPQQAQTSVSCPFEVIAPDEMA